MVPAGGPAAALPPGDEETYKGYFGERWVAAICSAAGCSTGRLGPDTVGTDLTVHDHVHDMIRIQVKTTESAPVVHNGAFSWELDVKTYDRLRAGNTPGYLVVVVLHRKHPRWTWHLAERGALVSASAYWVKVFGLPPTGNTSSITLSVPLGNMFTPACVLGLFDEEEGGEP